MFSQSSLKDLHPIESFLDVPPKLTNVNVAVVPLDTVALIEDVLSAIQENSNRTSSAIEITISVAEIACRMSSNIQQNEDSYLWQIQTNAQVRPASSAILRASTELKILLHCIYGESGLRFDLDDVNRSVAEAGDDARSAQESVFRGDSLISLISSVSSLRH
jgi:hypothetical protein